MLDCLGIESVADHALDSWNVLSSFGTVILLNVDPIKAAITREFPNVSVEDGVAVLGNESGMTPKAVAALHASARKCEQQYIEQLVTESFVKHPNGPQRLSSTPLLTNGVFNAASIISDPSAFMWVSIKLAEEVNRILDTERFYRYLNAIPNLRLLAVSLRASPFAVAVGLLTAKKVEIVDHMGPMRKIIEEHDTLQLARCRTYIYIGDFVVGGTEIRVAQTYAQGRSSTVNQAVVIGSVLHPQEYAGDCELHSLVNLKTVYPSATYSF